MGAFAEFERALINERQREGIVLAKQRGAYRGRKKALSAATVTELRARIAAGVSKAKVAREFGISQKPARRVHSARDAGALYPGQTHDRILFSDRPGFWPS